MEKKKLILAAALLVFVISSACFATDLLGGVFGNQVDEISKTLDNTLSEETILTLDSELDESLQEVEETQVAFADLTAEQVQETVNAALGMDLDEIKEKFPIPENALYITAMGEMVNFQMMQPADEVMDYYQIQLARDGLHYEEDQSYATGISTLLVYSGHSSGKLMSIQLVALNDGQTSVTIQFED